MKYIDSRYPGELGLLPDGKPSLEEAKGFYEFAKNIHETKTQSFNIRNSESFKKELP